MLFGAAFNNINSWKKCTIEDLIVLAPFSGARWQTQGFAT